MEGGMRILYYRKKEKTRYSTAHVRYVSKEYLGVWISDMYLILILHLTRSIYTSQMKIDDISYMTGFGIHATFSVHLSVSSLFIVLSLCAKTSFVIEPDASLFDANLVKLVNHLILVAHFNNQIEIQFLKLNV